MATTTVAKTPFIIIHCTYSVLFNLSNIGEFFRSWDFWETVSKGLYLNLFKALENRCLVFTSSTKREIRQVHLVVVQWRQTNVQKSVLYEQSCCFANLKLLPFCRPCSCQRRLLTSPIIFFLLDTFHCFVHLVWRWNKLQSNLHVRPPVESDHLP